MPDIYVACFNENCDEYQVPKHNAQNYSISEIKCGTCQGAVKVSGPPKEETGG